MNQRLSTLIVAIACLLMLPAAAFAQLPSPTYGWNLGNTLEPPSGEGSWGGTASQNLINGVANAGYNAVRIPCAWDSHANQSTYQIDANYMNRVKQVVDWCLARNMHVIINCHWDGGWLENNIGNSVNSTINGKMQSYWTQIGNTFRNYDNRVLFAGANEPNVETAAQMSTLIAYYQTFVNAVRNTGGNNSTRWLILSGPNTNTSLTFDLMNTLPNDPANPDRLAIEVHEYEPYNFTLMPQDESWGVMSYFWGAAYHSTAMSNRNSTWGEEAHIAAEFDKMRNKFVNNGIPVIVGEFTSVKRSSGAFTNSTEYNRHVASRTYYHKIVTDYANSRGLKPFYWDTPGSGTFNWTNGSQLDPDLIRSTTGGAALAPPGGGGGGGGSTVSNGTYRVISVHSGKAMDAYGAGTANGTQIIQWTYGGGNNQRWTLANQGSWYRITGVQSGKSLEISAWGTANGTKVQLWDYHGGTNQQFSFSNTGSNQYRITPNCATSSCLDVEGVSTADGAKVHLWTYGGGANQKWTLQAP